MGGQNHEKFSKREIQVSQNAHIYHRKSISAALTNTCVAPSVSTLACAEDSFVMGEFDQQRYMVLFWVTHRGGTLPRQRDQLLGVCIS